MDNLETKAILGTQDTERRQTKQKPKHCTLKRWATRTLPKPGWSSPRITWFCVCIVAVGVSRPTILLVVYLWKSFRTWYTVCDTKPKIYLRQICPIAFCTFQPINCQTSGKELGRNNAVTWSICSIEYYVNDKNIRSMRNNLWSPWWYIISWIF